jgi:hypothetical protein
MAQIDPTFPTQSQAPDYTGINSQIISGALQGAEILVNKAKEGIVSGVAEDLTGDINSVYEDSLKDTQPYPVVPGASPDEVALRNNLARLENVVNQGGRSQKSKAILDMQVTLEKAVSRYPKLRSELEDQYAHLLRVSPTLSKLDLVDEAAEFSAKQAADEITLVKNLAYGKVNEGGYGMDPALDPFGSPSFLRKYMQGNSVREMQRTSQQLVSALTSKGIMDAQNTYNTMHAFMGGQADMITTTFNRGLATADEISDIVLRVANGESVSTEDTRRVNVFQQDVVSGLKAQITVMSGELDKLWDNVAPEQVNTLHGQKLKDDIENMKSFASRYLEAIDVITTRPDLAKAIAIEGNLRTIQFKTDYKDLYELSGEVGELKPLLENADTLGLGDDIVKSIYGKNLTKVLESYLRTRFILSRNDSAVLDQIQANGGTPTVEQTSSALRLNRNNAQDPWSVGSEDPTDKSKAALAILNATSRSADQQFSAYQDSAIPVRDKQMANTFRTLASSFQELYDNGNAYNLDDMRLAKNSLNKPSLIATAIDFRAGTSTNEEAKQALALVGKEAEEWAAASPGGYSGEQQRIAKQATEKVLGVQLLSIIDPKFDKLDQGIVSFDVDRATIKRLYTEMWNRQQIGQMTSITDTGPSERDINKAYSKVVAMAAALGTNLSTELQFVANTMFFRNEMQDRPRYAQTYEQAGFTGIIPLSQGTK